MKSLHTRLDLQKEAVLSVTAKFGQWKAMQDFGVSDYVCFNKWLKEVTGDENFGLNPAIVLGGRQSLGDQLVAAFLRAVADLKTQVAERNQRIEFLEWQLDRGKERDELQAMAVLEVCQA